MSFWGHFGAVLASLWHDFEVVLVFFDPFGGFCVVFRPKIGHFGGAWVKKKNAFEPVNPILKRTLRAIDP